MGRGYEYAEGIEKKVMGHLKSLGFNVDKPPKRMTIERKLELLNYLRTVETAVVIIERAVTDTPIEGSVGDTDGG